MRTFLLLAAAVLALAAGATIAQADSDPAAAVKADLQKLVADATTLHSTIQADAAKISAEVQALQGSTDPKTVRATLQADWKQVQTDRARLLPPVQADGARLKQDLAAVHAAKAGSADLRAAVKQAHDMLVQERADARQALQAAHDAAQALRQSLKKK